MKRILSYYESALKAVEKWNGPAFKPSHNKDVKELELFPTNFHFQRIESTNFYAEFFTTGAFTAYARGFKNGGAALQRQKLMQSVSCESPDFYWKSFKNIL